MVVLLKGCILFEGENPKVVGLTSVEKINSQEEAEKEGERHLNEDDNADSYLVIGEGSKFAYVEWCNETFDKYLLNL